MNMIAEGVFADGSDSCRLGDGAGDMLTTVHLADGLLQPPAPGADPVGVHDASDYLRRAMSTSVQGRLRRPGDGEFASASGLGFTSRTTRRCSARCAIRTGISPS